MDDMSTTTHTPSVETMRTISAQIALADTQVYVAAATIWHEVKAGSTVKSLSQALKTASVKDGTISAVSQQTLGRLHAAARALVNIGVTVPTSAAAIKAVRALEAGEASGDAERAVKATASAYRAVSRHGVSILKKLTAPAVAGKSVASKLDRLTREADAHTAEAVETRKQNRTGAGRKKKTEEAPTEKVARGREAQVLHAIAERLEIGELEPTAELAAAIARLARTIAPTPAKVAKKVAKVAA